MRVQYSKTTPYNHIPNYFSLNKNGFRPLLSTSVIFSPSELVVPAAHNSSVLYKTLLFEISSCMNTSAVLTQATQTFPPRAITFHGLGPLIGATFSSDSSQSANNLNLVANFNRQLCIITLTQQNMLLAWSRRNT